MSDLLSCTLLCLFALCMYICIFACLKMAMHFVWGTHVVRRVPPSWSWALMTLEHGHALKVITVDAYSCYIVCITVTVWLPLHMSASDIGFLVYATCISVLILQWAMACLSINTLTHAVYIGMKPYRCTIVHQRLNFAIFSPWKRGIFLTYSHTKSLERIVFYVLWKI